MPEDNKIIPRENGSNGAIELLPASSRLPAWNLSPREPHLYDYLLILRKHQWLILSFMLAVVTITAIGTFRMQPVYIATSRIEIDRENSNILPFQGTDSYDYMTDLENYIETQSKILTSETLALQTVRSGILSGQTDFASDPSTSDALSTGSLANMKPPPELGAFLGSLSVKRVPNSRLMDVSFESTSPLLAAQIVNAHIKNFIEQNFQSRYDATTRASTWLTDQLNDWKIRVQKSEDARIAYERQNQIWALDDKQNVTSQRFSDLNKQLTDAQSERMRKQSLFEFARAGEMDSVPQIRDNPAVQDLLRKRTETYSQYTDALNQYGPNFPKVQRLQSLLKEIDVAADKEKKTAIARLENEYREALQREQILTRALDQQKTEVNQMSERMVQYSILKREAETNKALYDGLLTKLKEAGISAGLRSSNIRIVDPAMVPTYPARPAKTRNIALSFLVGLVGGIGLALLREYMDNTVKSPDERALLPTVTRSASSSLPSIFPSRKCLRPSAPCVPLCFSPRPTILPRSSSLPALCLAKAKPPQPPILPSLSRSSATALCSLTPIYASPASAASSTSAAESMPALARTSPAFPVWISLPFNIPPSRIFPPFPPARFLPIPPTCFPPIS